MGAVTRTSSRGRQLFLALTLLLLAAPVGLSAQEPSVPDVPEQRLREYVTLFRAMNEVRDLYHAQLARTHDREGKERVREEMDHRLAEVMQEHGFASEEYQRITFAVSADDTVRQAFDRLLEEARRNP